MWDLAGGAVQGYHDERATSAEGGEGAGQGPCGRAVRAAVPGQSVRVGARARLMGLCRLRWRD